MMVGELITAEFFIRYNGVLMGDSNIINRHLRYQKELTMESIFPSLEGICACGCKMELTGRRTVWASKECTHNALRQFHIIKGDGSVIREALWELDQGYCRSCGDYDDKWDADHIIPVHKGGGGCTIDNLQTLCHKCHSEKTHNPLKLDMPFDEAITRLSHTPPPPETNAGAPRKPYL